MAMREALSTLRARLISVKLHHLNKPKPVDTPAAISRDEWEMVEEGSCVFELFFDVGCRASEEGVTSFKDLKDDSVVSSTGELIVDTQRWLHRFLCGYPSFKIHIDDDQSIGKEACVVRSGLQFMLDLFKESSTEKLDEVLAYLESESVPGFDFKIKMAKEYTTFTVLKEDVPKEVPQSHSWWY